MANVEFANGEMYVPGWGYGNAEYTPVYMIINNNKKFVRNLCHPISGDTETWRKYTADKSKRNIGKAKKTLSDNGGKYFTIYGLCDDPFDFLSWINKNGYTLETVGIFFAESSNHDFTDFLGNSREYSCAFYYRIYDEITLNELKNTVSHMKQIVR